MSQRSCGGNMLRGCGTLLVLLLVAGLIGYLVYRFDTFAPSQETPVTAELRLADLDQQQPHHLVLEMSTGSIQLVPDGGDRFWVEGQVDQANYDFTYKPNKKGTGQKLAVRSKHTSLAYFFHGRFMDKQNRLTIHVPKNLVLELEMKLSNTRTDMDLNGISVQALDMRAENSDVLLNVSEPNPIAMKKWVLVMRSRHGNNAQINDLNFLRCEKAWINANGVLLEIQASKLLSEPLALNAKIELGGLRLYLPDKQPVEDHIGMMVGVFNKRGDFTNEDQNQAVLSLSGHIGGGEFFMGSRADSIFRDLRNQGWSLDQQEYMAKLSSATAEDASSRLKPDQINTLGYTYLYRGKPQLALAIFEHNIATYPNYANGYDSYAEGLMVNGDQEKAIEYYQLALEKDPRNRNAVKQLKKLGAQEETK